MAEPPVAAVIGSRPLRGIPTDCPAGDARHAPELADNGSTATASERSGDVFRADRWYGLVRAFPHTAKRVLNPQRVHDPVMLAALQAQAAIRLGLPREAIACAELAVQSAGREQPMGPGRLLAAATLLADAAVLAGAPDGIAACTDLIELTNRFGDRSRAPIASGLHAVAIFHQQGCVEAAALLIGLGHACTAPNTFTAMKAAHAALTSCCTRRREPHWPPTQRPLITAGGWVPTELTEPFFADRLLRWPGIHTCAWRPA